MKKWVGHMQQKFDRTENFNNDEAIESEDDQDADRFPPQAYVPTHQFVTPGAVRG